jgi:anti-anti-sigma factor
LFKITVDELRDTRWLKLEGRITGNWAKEFERAWNELSGALDSRKFVIDLRGVTHMDGNGQRVLAAIYRQTGAEFLTDSPLTTFFAEEARRNVAESTKREE